MSLHKQADANFDQTLQAESASLKPLSSIPTSGAIQAHTEFSELKMTENCSDVEENNSIQ